MAAKFKLTPLHRFTRASDDLSIQQAPSIPHFENRDPLVRQPISCLAPWLPSLVLSMYGQAGFLVFTGYRAATSSPLRVVSFFAGFFGHGHGHVNNRC